MEDDMQERKVDTSNVRFEPGPKWVRVLLGGQFIADSKRVGNLSTGGTPRYCFPMEDVRMDLLEPAGGSQDTQTGTVSYFTVKAGNRVVEKGAMTWTQPAPEAPGLQGYISFEWGKMDAWFEEEEEVYGHAHDPYKRIDTLISPRHIEVIVLGEKVADSRNAVFLFEGVSRPRYYLPRTDVRQDLLVPSSKTSVCAYKGSANYYSIKVGDQIAEDIVWYYRYPAAEVIKIAGRVAFYSENVEAFYIDGQKEQWPIR